ncbi:hypothetical protein [Pantoea ananatis]|uniref:hypothetical protein n=1 Tax=Pantoea ananas TaxID=553 RepID=UPI00351DA857
MKKPAQTYGHAIPNGDFKAAVVMERDEENFESPNIWIYLGADIRDRNYAKVGHTMDDLRSRSYSSANPHYYIFCAFQCVASTTELQLKTIETGVLAHLDSIFPKHRAHHYESKKLSECYYDIDFDKLFIEVHDYLHDKNRGNFMTVTHLNEIEIDDGYTLVMEFNPRIPLNTQRKYIELIKRY